MPPRRHDPHRYQEVGPLLARWPQITGRRNNREGAGRQGWEFVHVAVDDTTRLAYVEVLPDEKQWTAAAFLVRATRWFRERGIKVRRVMTDQRRVLQIQSVHQNMSADRSAPHPYAPLYTADKRQSGTLHSNPDQRMGVRLVIPNFRCPEPPILPRWLDWYNSRRPHGAHEGRSPRQALNNGETTSRSFPICGSLRVLIALDANR